MSLAAVTLPFKASGACGSDKACPRGAALTGRLTRPRKGSDPLWVTRAPNQAGSNPFLPHPGPYRPSRCSSHGLLALNQARLMSSQALLLSLLRNPRPLEQAAQPRVPLPPLSCSNASFSPWSPPSLSSASDDPCQPCLSQGPPGP